MKKIYYCTRIITSILFLFMAINASANHIVGGDMAYECLGNNVYRITLKVYKDCSVSGPNVADFDDPATITIYKGTSSTPFLNHLESLPQSNRSNIPIDLSNPCLEPPTGVCVEQAIYEFDVTLPYDPQGYHISYERCCRNSSITNIPNPGTWGATFTIYISDLAQTSCNTSPEFNSFPPIVICANQPVNFDHGAVDADGDSLVYSFCAPFHGGSQSDPKPIEAAAPPYTNVPFSNPYSASAPLAGNPTVTINPNTGFISGVPTSVGQYVVGVCVDEYKNGVWVSTTKRDFQFNVTSCELQVLADIQEDSLIGDDQFIVNSCGDTTVTFINESGQPQYITGYQWIFPLGNGNTFTTTTTNATVTFPNYGTYVGMMIVNPGAAGCTDTAFIITNIYPEPTADFSYTYDSCVIGPVVFTDESSVYPGGAPIVDWRWDYKDDSISRVQSPSYQFKDAGTFDVELRVTDGNGCQSTSTAPIVWAPAPIIDIVPSSNWGCAPEDIAFENNSYPINGYSTIWQLGDGFLSADASPTHTYETPGTYTVTIMITSPLGCVSWDTFPDLIHIFDSPIPSFTTSYDSCAYGPVTFTDFSTPGESPIVAWEWIFDDGNTASDTNIVYQYDSAGSYLATLQVTDQNGCVKEAHEQIDWFPAPIVQVAQDNFRGCAPYNVQIENTSYPINGYFLLWNLGDGYYTDEPSPIHTYEDPGTYTLSLAITSPTGCYEETTFPDLVIVDPNPVAAFSYTPDELTNFDSQVTLTDESIDAVEWLWDFGNGDTSSLQNPVYNYLDTGIHYIKLEVTHETGCKDSVIKKIDIEPKFTFFLPNALTPNDDAINDGYRGVGELFGVKDYNMTIWNRYGELIFETTDPLQVWNGRKGNTGDIVQNGVYVAVVSFIGPRGKKYEFKEFATVIR